METLTKEISSGNLQEPVILVTATTWWPLSARLAQALSQNGCKCVAICPRGHPLRTSTGVGRIFSYSPWRPIAALAAAIAAVQPDLVVPTDDRGVFHLHLLHAAHPSLRPLIERSLGTAASFPLVGSRAGVLGLAAQEGVAMPANAAIAGVGDLGRFHAGHPFPWVLKRDRSWGGRGVRIVHDLAEAQAAFRRMVRPPGLSRAAKNLLVNRDPFPLGEWFKGVAPEVSVQEFVTGRPANCLALCWNGAVLAEICVEVLCTTDPLGAATIVRVIDNRDMAQAASRLVARLGLSGFCGFDFMLDQVSGHALLIELNPRTTQLGHLNLGPGRDLATRLAALLTNRTMKPKVAIVADTIALFPGAAQQSPASFHLDLAYHDLPEDPVLLRELRRTPWEHRSLLSRIGRWWRAQRPTRSPDWPLPLKGHAANG